MTDSASLNDDKIARSINAGFCDSPTCGAIHLWLFNEEGKCFATAPIGQEQARWLAGKLMEYVEGEMSQ